LQAFVSVVPGLWARRQSGRKAYTKPARMQLRAGFAHFGQICGKGHAAIKLISASPMDMVG